MYLDGILGGMTIGTTLGSLPDAHPGRLHPGSRFNIRWDLILNAGGNPDAIFIFQIDGFQQQLLAQWLRLLMAPLSAMSIK